MTPENVELMQILRQKKANKLAARERRAAQFKLAVITGAGLLAVLAVSIAVLLSPDQALPVATAAATVR